MRPHLAGIGRPASPSEVPAYVLQPFDPKEAQALHDSMMPRTDAMVAQWIAARLQETKT